MYDAIVVSDFHLGSDVCQAKKLNRFLDLIDSGELPTKELILNGDVFDSWDFRRLCKQHWKVLSGVRKISDKIKVIWVNGNHDGPAEIVSHLLGVHVVEEYIFRSGEKTVMALHGHQFDNFITDHPFLTYLADFFYYLLQKLDPSYYWARRAKKASKTFLRCSQKVEDEARKYSKKKNCDTVCCGHTHMEVASPGYYNSGCWTELPCNYLTFFEGEIKLCSFEEDKKCE